ncbi:hypothetical protein OG311_37815 (plasmid) [Streptomyces sp. NBC_01343]|uniref:hypothetical protein n=1 Tax=Streptomyces sp. NBC_01343 TaxID=2903832 RepID=UPI002E109BE0|nr:hypothetical protein OG311_37815 [Streptomyces sp. NBC_01343]
MTTGSRPRFSVRLGLVPAPEHDGPFEGVPEHLQASLQKWVRSALLLGRGDDVRAAEALCLRMRLVAHRSEYVSTLANTYDFQLLDVIDRLLELAPSSLTAGNLVALESLLDDAGSAYRINEDQDGLEERVTPAVRDAVQQTLADAAAQATAGSAADHLAAAWQAAYGRSPDPVRAYSEAIKAVESAAHAVIQPNNPKATLGTMLGEIKNARHKLTTAIPTPGNDPIAPVEAMMRALWEGQTSRHGAQNGTVPETLEAARAGVHLAAALVQWFVSGAVIRNP